MKPFLADSRLQVVGALILVGTAIAVGLSGFKLPALKTTNLNSSNTPSMNSSQTVSQAYVYPGQLPAEKIAQKQARLVTNRGEIVFALDAAQSPLAVSNLVYLAELGYYNGILWHRVESWVVQAGDPQTKDSRIDPELWGSGGPGYTIPDETVTGEYTTGVVAMAKTQAPNSAGSQFFILLTDTPLPKTYQILGKVTTGMEVVQVLTKGDKIESLTIEPAA